MTLDLIDLLDKQQKTSFRMMQIIINSQFHTTIDALLTEIDVSLPTIQKELYQLQEELFQYDSQATLRMDIKNRITLQLPLTFSLKHFFYESYYAKAINLQLIESFYFQRERSIARLTIEFKISESSLFRRLKQINLLFKEFDLKYKNNRLIGDAAAFQFFYFDFFSGVYPQDVLLKLFNRSNFYHLVKIIESNLSCEFNQNQANDFVLWLSIAEKKINDSLLNPLRRKKQAPVSIDERAFKELEQIFMRFSSRYAVQWPQEEIISAYHFLLAEGMIRYTYTDHISSNYLSKLDQLTRKIAQLLAPESLEIQQTIYPRLFMAHCQLKFFHHIISNDFSMYYLLTDTNTELMNDCMVLVEATIPFAISTNQWQKLDAIYGRIYHYIEQKKKNKQINRNVYLHIKDPLLIEETQELLNDLINKFPFLHIHLVTILEEADIILGDKNHLPPIKKVPYYMMQEHYWTPYEIQRLTIFLTEQLYVEGMN